MTEPLPPIRRTIDVPWAPEVAFARFTRDFGDWWPHRSHSIGGSRVARVVFECRDGGRIYERLHDGRRFAWGRVRHWQPPTEVRFDWHPSRDEDTAQQVRVRFEPHAGGTRVVLEHSGWERMGAEARGTRSAYDKGWPVVLDIWAERITLGTLLLGALTPLVPLIVAARGGAEAMIARAGGAMPPSDQEP